MTSRPGLAATLGMAGAGFGIVAGIVQATVGARIPNWTGAKDSPVALGLLTIVLSLLAAGCALGLARISRSQLGHRLALALGLLIPAGLCFSTVGRLWFLPGPLLLCAAGIALAPGSRKDYSEMIRSHWLAGLVSVLGAAELLMAVSAAPAVAVIGVIGGLALIAAPWLAPLSRTLSGVLLAVGVVPFTVLTYWAIIPIVLALLALLIAAPLVLRGSTHRQHPA
jgi:hypothetical protein